MPTCNQRQYTPKFINDANVGVNVKDDDWRIVKQTDTYDDKQKHKQKKNGQKEKDRNANMKNRKLNTEKKTDKQKNKHKQKQTEKQRDKDENIIALLATWSRTIINDHEQE